MIRPRQIATVLVGVGLVVTVTTLLAQAPVHGDPARLERIRAAKMPKIDKPILFDTPEADAILSALEVFPPDNPWNLVVEDWPVHPELEEHHRLASAPTSRSATTPTWASSSCRPTRRRSTSSSSAIPDESDKGPFPVPDNMPIEGWPVELSRNPKTEGPTLDDVQRDKLKEGRRPARPRRRSDQPDAVRVLPDEEDRRGLAGVARRAIFDLKSNKLRPDGWTSADAAGLPIFPAVVRYDEIKRGMVEHAMRVTVVQDAARLRLPGDALRQHATRTRTCRAWASASGCGRTSTSRGFSPEVQAILKGLKKYGMFVADNGIDWAISVAPDPRIRSTRNCARSRARTSRWWSRRRVTSRRQNDQKGITNRS